jgi:alkanesulfonate monooxygenase SsuD/methylene tetrahydromethanopterin reductase-like flavin-dependent oxidoreductase (luciferase family)
MDHASRYERMEEFVDVCNQLWTSVEADAMVWDRASGRVGVPSKIHDVFAVSSDCAKVVKVLARLCLPRRSKTA